MRSESLNKRFSGASLLLVLAACALAQGTTFFKIATTDDHEMYPSVSGDVVVWQFFNSRYGDWDIEAAEVTDGEVAESFTVADLGGDDLFPIIDGNDVVWQYQYSDDSDGDVYGARIENGQVLSRFTISASEDDERFPSVSDGVAVWQHGFVGAPDWDVLGARLTGEDAPEAFIVSAMIDVDEICPCISSKWVIWQQRSLDLLQPFAYGADISDPNTPRIFYTNMALGSQEFPSFSDGWLGGRETDDAGRVMADNLFDPFNPEGISGSNLTACPKVHKHIVVWQDGSNGTWDIHGYNLNTRQEFAITSLKMSNQVNPAVYADTDTQQAIVVWQDDRDGNWDIYGAILDGPEVATSTEP